MREIKIGWFYEDFEIGGTFKSQRRTITEADIVLFAGLSSDYNPLHTDEIFAQESEYKGRIAHGMLVISIMTGLIVRLNILDNTTKAFQNLEWRFVRPVRAGDTIYAKAVIEQKEEINRADAGLVTFKTSLFNQANKTVGRGKLVLLMAKKNQAQEEKK